MYLYYSGDIQDNGDGQMEHRILANRRKELKLTQQQVAERAGIQLRQYQRLEGGDRNITGSTGRVLLAVCKVLKLDPYTLVGSGNQPPEVKHIVFPPIETQGLKYVIPSLAYYTLVSAIPRGMVCSDDDIMVCLRKAYGIGDLEIKSDMNSAQVYMSESIPFWRVVSAKGYLINQFYCSKEKQCDYLTREGVAVSKVGSNESYRVDEYAYLGFKVTNLKITVLKTDKEIMEQFQKLQTEDK